MGWINWALGIFDVKNYLIFCTKRYRHSHRRDPQAPTNKIKAQFRIVYEYMKKTPYQLDWWWWVSKKRRKNSNDDLHLLLKLSCSIFPTANLHRQNIKAHFFRTTVKRNIYFVQNLCDVHYHCLFVCVSFRNVIFGVAKSCANNFSFLRDASTISDDGLFRVVYYVQA